MKNYSKNDLFEITYKKKLVDTLRFAVSFFEKHNLNYFCAFGTAIGAVRHHGIIPWDDDIDILMPPEDYERLIMIADQLQGTHYRLATIHDDNYYLPFTKIYDKNTTLLEEPRYSYVLGVYIDVHPLVRMDITLEDYERKIKRINRNIVGLQNSLAHYSYSEMLLNLRNHNFGALVQGIASLFFPYKLAIKFKEKIEKDLKSSHSGKQYFSTTGVYGTKEIYPVEWFSQYILMKFEDFEVRLPVSYHEYLTQIYGDYMKLPPKNKQIPHHGQYFIELNESLSMEQIQIRMKSDGRK